MTVPENYAGMELDGFEVEIISKSHPKIYGRLIYSHCSYTPRKFHIFNRKI